MPSFLKLAYTVIATGIAFSLVLVIFIWIYQPEPLMKDYEPAIVLNLETIQDDGYVLVELEKCTVGDEGVAIITFASLHHADGRTRDIVPGGVSHDQLPPGECTNVRTFYEYPIGLLPPGQWRVTGVDAVINQPENAQILTWSTPYFGVE